MATLDDRLDYLLGRSTARKLEENFGIRTVNELLRHYPRKYSEGMTVRGEDEDLDLEEGDHVTFVDVITAAKWDWMKAKPGKPRRKWLLVTLGNHRPKVTAMFFNADYLIAKLVPDTRIMLSGEVGAETRNVVEAPWFSDPAVAHR